MQRLDDVKIVLPEWSIPNLGKNLYFLLFIVVFIGQNLKNQLFNQNLRARLKKVSLTPKNGSCPNL